MKRTQSSDTVGSPSSIWRDLSFSSTRPALSEFLGDPTFDDRTPRQTGTLLLFCDGSLLKACLTDREQNLVAFLTSQSFDGLMDALEEGLQTQALDWRVKAPYRPKK